MPGNALQTLDSPLEDRQEIMRVKKPLPATVILGEQFAQFAKASSAANVRIPASPAAESPNRFAPAKCSLRPPLIPSIEVRIP